LDTVRVAASALERAHVFVVRDGLILALRQASTRGWWEFPGGDLEPGEAAAAAAIRETLEEAGLAIDAPDLLRTWSYHNAQGVEIIGHAHAAESPAGGVALSDEHVDFAWMSVDEYERRYCSEAMGEAVPQYAEFFTGLRENCRLFRDWLTARSEE
jgi:8-oxo-dGTP pyrophosphatase MutT (NUDIX family)